MPITQNWDSGGSWDLGLSWDSANVIANSGDITPYTNLVTSEHANKPNFISTLSTVLQPIADNILSLQLLDGLFDLATAVGDQLDIIGKWIGVSRNLTIPISNVFFSFDIDAVGFDSGTWFGPTDTGTTLTQLPDDSYRILLYAKIANNHWDGTIPGAYAIYAILFAAYSFEVFIQDNQDMTMYFGVSNGSPDALTIALLKNGYISVRPDGVEILAYLINSVPNTLAFGFDSTGPALSGFDIGSWATQLN